jgi:hypothetical protein
MKARVGFGRRFTLNPITEDMIVPFAVFAADETGKFTINRTKHYLVDKFGQLYGSKLSNHPAWKQWTTMVDLLDDKVGGAFAGQINLHDFEAQIDSLAATYEQLRLAVEPQAKTIFVFHTDEFWLNLHHFLYVLGRAQNKTSDSARGAVVGAPADQEKGFAALTSKERATWTEAVAAYASDLSKQDMVFDDHLRRATKALAHAGDAKTLMGVEVSPATAKTLEGAAPIYRQAWWPKHHSANQAWESATKKLIDRYGETVLTFITKAYQMSWPNEGYPVHISAYSNWAGAYSTSEQVLVLASLNQSTNDAYGLETIFHEAMHQWDSEIYKALREHARRADKRVPRSLSHALIFFTAGEAIRRVVAGHVPYADKFGVWERGMIQFKAPLIEVWKPYLDGQGTREEAFAELIKRTATEPRPTKPGEDPSPVL